jgi:CRP-like cAMP-binding protein
MNFPESLMQSSQLLHLERNQTVFRNGKVADAVFRVQAGEVHLLRYAPDGAAVVIHRARPGDFFAEASLFGKRYHCDAVCIKPSICLRLPANALRQALQEDPVLAMEWIATLSGNLRRQRSALERMALKGTRARIAHYLVDRGENGKITLDQPLIEWARELGVSHEALYRTLAAMEKDQSLLRGGNTLQLLKGMP